VRSNSSPRCTVMRQAGRHAPEAPAAVLRHAPVAVWRAGAFGEGPREGGHLVPRKGIPQEHPARTPRKGFPQGHPARAPRKGTPQGHPARARRSGRETHRPQWRASGDGVRERKAAVSREGAITGQETD